MSDDELVTVKQKEPRATRGTQLAFTLTVVEGPDQGAAATFDGQQPSRTLVGQSPVCTLRLTDRRVSRRHFAAELSDEGLRVTDASSTNGTFVDGVHVREAVLHGGEIIRIGETAIRVDAGAPVEPEALSLSLSKADRFGRLHGVSPEMRRLYPTLERIAQSDVPVVIEGETGTGKEVLAEALHEASGRAQGPFIVFDCTAVPPSLVESALFGHERGAFTGAVATRLGVFEQAHGGTLLIDEIGDLDVTLQPKLLRALERREVRRVGGDKWIKVDVRVLAATRRDLDLEVQDGRFRDDLFFRIAVARVELPPLRDRRGDVAALTRLLWRRLGAEGEPPYPLIVRLERHPWPGNVRELANAVARYVAMGDLELNEDLRPGGAGAEGGSGVDGDAISALLARDLPFPRARDAILAEFERRYVQRVLAAHGGNVTRAAEASGIGRRYFTTLVSRTGK